MISKQQLQNDMKLAMKAKEVLKKSVISGLLASIQLKSQEKRTALSKTITDIAELEKQQELTEEEILNVLSTEAKKRRESIDQFTKGARPELAQQESDELAIILTYLPEQLSEDTIREIIQKTITDTNAKGLQDIGKIMPIIMSQTKGKADGSLVSKMVKEILSA